MKSYSAVLDVSPDSGRSPCGERGLKSIILTCINLLSWSLPVRGAWIEIANAGKVAVLEEVAPRAGSVD